MLTDEDLEQYGHSAVWTIGSYEEWLYFVPEYLLRALDGKLQHLDMIWHKADALALLGETERSRRTQTPLPGRWAPERVGVLQQVLDAVWVLALEDRESGTAPLLLRDASSAGLFPSQTVWSAADAYVVAALIEDFNPGDPAYAWLADELGTDEVGEILLAHAHNIQPEWRREAIWWRYEQLKDARRPTRNP